MVFTVIGSRDIQVSIFENELLVTMEAGNFMSATLTSRMWQKFFTQCALEETRVVRTSSHKTLDVTEYRSANPTKPERNYGVPLSPSLLAEGLLN